MMERSPEEGSEDAKMRFLYYPGCSLKGTGRAYEESLLAVFEALGVALEELPDWNCCGATSYMSVDEGMAFAVAARNLARAEQMADGAPYVDVVAPCSACFMVLTKTRMCLEGSSPAARRVLAAMKTAGLSYRGRVRVRHPLDVLLNDVGVDAVAAAVRRPLGDLACACYYGCQAVRPYETFDSAHRPESMDRLLRAAGAQVVDWPLKTRCCGGSLTGTVPPVGARLSTLLLQEAGRRGARVVATCCPLCQFNLECCTRPQEGAAIPVVFFTQLLGLAFGLPERRIGLQRLLVPLSPACAAESPGGGRHVSVR